MSKRSRNRISCGKHIYRRSRRLPRQYSEIRLTYAGFCNQKMEGDVLKELRMLFRSNGHVRLSDSGQWFPIKPARDISYILPVMPIPDVREALVSVVNIIENNGYRVMRASLSIHDELLDKRWRKPRV